MSALNLEIEHMLRVTKTRVLDYEVSLNATTVKKTFIKIP